MKNRTLGWLLASLLVLLQPLFAWADTAPDPTGAGPFTSAQGNYQFPPAVMPDVLSDRATELWAQVYYPTGAGVPSSLPMIVVLHGNHGTCGRGSNPRIDDSCQYTTTGTCPAGYVVTPNHLGYAYFAQQLASWGYFVVSINANLGITCGSGVSGDSGLNLARGRLILKHLQKISLWATGVELPPASLGFTALTSLDFGRVGLAGHSRGGEGVRAAYVQYKDTGSTWPGAIKKPVNFSGIFEIGAVDGQTSRVLDAKGVPWNQVLPMCDGDVSDLEGIKPYDRMWNDTDEKPVVPKSTYAVWGANHNFFNTEWQQSDSSGCSGHTPIFSTSATGSTQQQTMGLTAASAFFRTHLAAVPPDLSLIENFDPLFALPTVASSITKVDRNFLLSPNGTTAPPLEDFTKPTGTSLEGFPNIARSVTVSHGTVPEDDSSYRAGKLTWNKAGRFVMFQNVWAARGGGIDLSAYDTLDFRVSRTTSALNPAPQTPTDFSIALVGSDGRPSSQLLLSTYKTLLGPVGNTSNRHQNLLTTVRIPLKDFVGVALNKVTGLRITFNKTTTGEIYLSGIRADKFTSSAVLASADAGGEGVVAMADAMTSQAQAAVQLKGVVRSVRPGVGLAALKGGSGVEIELALEGGAKFPVRGALAVLEVGSSRFTLSRHPDDGDTNRLVFSLTSDEYAKLRRGDAIRVFYGSATSESSNWEARFGNLNR